MREEGDDRPRSSLLARILKWGSLRWFRQGGWRVEGDLPPGPPKFVIAGAPHTSNYDFLVFLGVVDAFGLTPRFIGKHSLFRWPLGDFMRAMGGVPVDRSKRGNMVQQVAAQIRAAEEFALVIAIEGTRSPTSEWRTGFYRIAMEAGVPIVCAGPNYRERIGILGPTIYPTGDYEADMQPAFDFFASLDPRHRGRVLFPDGQTLDQRAQALSKRASRSSGTGGSTPDV